MAATTRKKRAPGTFGTVETLPSGRHRARYRGPDGRRYTAPTLFLTKQDARGWLALRQAEIIRRAWEPPDAQAPTRNPVTFGGYAETWLQQRDLKERTEQHYNKLLTNHLLPTFGALPLTSITPDDVRAWHTAMGTGTPTLRAHAYGLMRTIMGTAASDGKINTNPCVIRGAGTAHRVHKIRPATLPQLETITASMPEAYRLMILLGAWCALRYGELAELRRRDVDLDDEIVRIERGVVRVDGGKFKVTTPKSNAGIRDVSIPPHLLPAIEDHLSKYVDSGQDSLLFPAINGGHLAPGTMNRWYYQARAAAGRPDLRFHDLRHSGAVLAAATGATLAELMDRLGHSTPAAAMRYQHASKQRGREIAALLSKLAENG
ncbi:tyrosine-type recombinase/integrase [Mycolicibacter virginiensis]|uniref:tyrosine-type recombinase/integrase n=1 Tax=Mycolicibacter virginiensis TaxID=1795032 RepID=UPI001F04F76A|nr:site-specific integrase [Mycolicibacter virginiensis]ULP45946.1 site-specific integrase [Mycolicibacter virginiensis]